MNDQQSDLRHLDTLDRDLDRFSSLGSATNIIARPMVGLGISFVFVVVAGIASMLFFGSENNTIIVVAAACLGAYMALNIGANDVANNMGPAVGANALSMGGLSLLRSFLKVLGH
jgi:PiT family inorganic phosphate transporter